ncbi:hypothetical protein AYL99_11844 [Fonsecaea erecta]|uniref:Uncharacterized protein n=1 Tax=Fonsecaea erecta TaxID=1367422 RepID=A0A178Z2N9_9EURO|nr:hypothetical protein AYL99_11844 [Fonsecaea erecta]OAP53964.1 hypothetical protein AYL99_11844 [Fonsecaea erecta]
MDLSIGEELGYGSTAYARQSPSTLQPSTGPDQLQEVLKLAEDVATYKRDFTADNGPLVFTISIRSWLILQRSSNFLLCTARNLFHASFNPSRSVVTIIPPPEYSHETGVHFLRRGIFKTRSNLMSTLKAKTKKWLQGGLGIKHLFKKYKSAKERRDFLRRWRMSRDEHEGIHTMASPRPATSYHSLFERRRPKKKV